MLVCILYLPALVELAILKKVVFDAMPLIEIVQYNKATVV